MKRFPPHRRRGVTLIEALTTIGVMAALLPVLLQGFTLAGRIAEATRDTAEATAIAQAELERLIATYDWLNGGSGDVTVAPTTYHWEATLTDFDAEPNVQTLTVDVRWSRRGAEHNVTLTSIVYIPESTVQTTETPLMGGGL